MHDEHVTLTREALYDKVWKTPMSRLAAEFGISDVALAKIRKKLDVPIPGRGYWARVTNGQKVKQPKLSKLRVGARAEFTIAKREPRDPSAPKEQPDVPDVVVADSLAGAHPAVRKLSSLLDGREPGRAKTLYLRGDSEATVRLGEKTKRRALLILDAVLKALEARGHSATFKVPKDAWSPHDLEVKIGSETVKLFIAEPLTRTEHKLTPKEEADRIRYGRSLFAPKHDFDPSGRLSLRARGHYAKSRRWSDGMRQQLEDVLGTVVLGIEDVARRTAERRAEFEESDRRYKEEERRRQTKQVLHNYEQALSDELERSAEDLRRAMAIRELLHAVENAPVPNGKADAVNAWLAWAAAVADEIDPRTDAARPARVVKPDPSAMSEEEFKYWRDWPESEKRVSAYSPGFEPWSV
jgi:hypothetical protein